MTNQEFIESILKKKNIVQEELTLWFEAAMNLRDSVPDIILNDLNFEKFTLNCLFIDDYILLGQEIYKHYKTYGSSKGKIIEKLFMETDDSTLGPREWIVGMAFFYRWLDKKNQTGEFSKMLGYINCCLESNENRLVTRELTEIMEEMLDSHGFNAAIKK